MSEKNRRESLRIVTAVVMACWRCPVAADHIFRLHHLNDDCEHFFRLVHFLDLLGEEVDLQPGAHVDDDAPTDGPLHAVELAQQDATMLHGLMIQRPRAVQLNKQQSDKHQV